MTTAQRRFAAELGLDYDALSDEGRRAVFERFATFQTLRRFHGPEIEPAELDMVLSGGATAAHADGAVLVVGGQIIKSVEQLDAHVDLAADALSAELVVIRASRANRFDRSAIAAFFSELVELHSDDESKAEPASGDETEDLLWAFKSRLAKIGARPRVRLYAYYIALGVWDDERDGGEALSQGRRQLRGLETFDEVECEAIDKMRLLDLMSSGAPLPLIGGAGEREEDFDVPEYEAELPRSGLVALPSIPGVSAGFYGHVPVSDFLELLERSDGQGMREAIFHQNVRGYQGDGGVNERIRRTLAGPERAHFLLRNNGVTIVSDEIEEEDDAVALLNYQIVNGLQTSTVLYRLRDELRDADDVHVPIKLVAARDWPLRRSIIEATNRQTPITGAALFSACEKAVEIERYYKLRAAAGGPPIYLERRPGQFPLDFPHPRISLEDMLRAFYAVFREAPQTAEKGFSAIAGELDDGLLAPSLSPEPYYLAGRLLCLVRDVARQRDEARLAQVEHHAAYALRVVAAPQEPPIGDAVAMREVCKDIELKLSAAGRNELAAIMLRVTESPRERMRRGVQGVPTLKRTKQAVERRAREEHLGPEGGESRVVSLRPARADVA